MSINIETKTDWENQKDKGKLVISSFLNFALFLPPAPPNNTEV